MERPYVTGGGDFENKTGLELFRLDVENHGKTAAFMTGYDLQFAKLAELQKDPTVRDVRKNHFRHMDGISPQGARKIIRTQYLSPRMMMSFLAPFGTRIYLASHTTRDSFCGSPTGAISGERVLLASTLRA
jgi:hypothetical protein